jgi:3-oxoacyl-[acyl-carrier protein] reductase
MTNTLTGRVALVTGASRGIGRAIAREFAACGARVAIHYHAHRAAAEETLAALPGGPHRVFQADVADPAAAEALVNAVVAEMGRLDVLVNNAGVFEPHPPAEASYEDWREAWRLTLGANLLGPANLSFCAVHPMRAQGGGKIIQISSRGAFRGEPDAPAYGASKAGLNALSQSLAKALAPLGIMVYCIAPGWVATDMAAPYLAGAAGDAVRAQSPLNRVAAPEEIARTAAFLAGDGTDFLTGCIIDVNGASYLRT